MRDILGYNPDELIGKSIHQLMKGAGHNAISDALEAAANNQEARFGHKKGFSDISDPPSFIHQMCHKSGHALPAHTTFSSGDTNYQSRPSFLVAHTHFSESYSSSAPAAAKAVDEEFGYVRSTSHKSTRTPNDSNLSPHFEALGPELFDPSYSIGLKAFPPGNRAISSSNVHAKFLTELSSSHKDSGQMELSGLQKQNLELLDELQQLLSRRKERRRKESDSSLEKLCAVCNTKNTPEWRRGPSGNRDLCNRCGLRWAKETRSKAQSAACLPAKEGADRWGL